MNKVKRNKLASIIGAICLGTAFSSTSQAVTAEFDPATNQVEIPVVEVLNGTSSQFFRATLRLAPDGLLDLISADPIPPAKGQERNVFDAATGAVHFSSVSALGGEFYAKLRLVPVEGPLRFTLEQLVNNTFEGCPDFATAGPAEGTCVLSGELIGNITLTKNTQWILNGNVFVGGDNDRQSVITINPGTHIFGQQGNDFLMIRRGSKIMAEGTPDNPIVMAGALQQGPGEWGGLELHGRAPVNGCNEGVEVCELPNVAVQTEFFGGNDPLDNSGVIKYVQLLNTGFAVRPDEELNCLTMNGIGAGTLIDFVHCHNGADDGFETFGGTVNLKHIVATNMDDDSLDWQFGWQGAAQFVLVQQSDNFGDNGVEGDNQKVTESLPRSRPTVSNMTVTGSASVRDRQAMLLRVGTGGRIWNSVFTGFPVCITVDDEPTFLNAGAPGSLSGELTINNSFVNCPVNFREGDGPTFTVAEWFLSQPGNNAEVNLGLNGFLPMAGSPLIGAGVTGAAATVITPFIEPVDYAGAFRDENDDWTQEWTFPVIRR
ncbi:MAG: hypothetical protein CVV13_14545 [Gammaproteobacteria bacterium HGW-Gammaproteobacteria-3]|nr:MAG: hypothetical protein CVV13_14545 [Gammaproteobacteria bacterium HGW-Gammaproteobacteria-3]